MSESVSVTCAFFVIDSGDRHLLFAPLQGFLCEVGAEAAAALRRVRRQTAAVSEEETVLLAALRLRGFSHSDPAPPPGRPTLHPIPFRPQSVVLDLTTDCNLRCIYCYASAGESAQQMSPSCAHRAIEIAHENALIGDGVFQVFFHGGGEPTSAWPLLQGCVNHARRLERERSAKHFIIRMTTNGALEPDQVEWVATNFSGVSLSFDGPPEIQNHQRPCRDGSGSFDRVYRTAKLLHAKGFQFGIKAIVTGDSVDRMLGTAEFFHQELPGIAVSFEPVSGIGRCLESRCAVCSDEAFTLNLIRALGYARDAGMDLSYSGAPDPHFVRTEFCGASDPSFGVTVEERVASCLGVPRAPESFEPFVFGRFDPDRRAFLFDESRIARLSRLHSFLDPRCRECFARFHCTGDCPGIGLRLAAGWDRQDLGLGRCAINRPVLEWHLLHLLDKGGEPNGASCRRDAPLM